VDGRFDIPALGDRLFAAAFDPAEDARRDQPADFDVVEPSDRGCRRKGCAAVDELANRENARGRGSSLPGGGITFRLIHLDSDRI